MKPIEQVTVCVVDYGYFISLTRVFVKAGCKVYYHCPCQKEYQDMRDFARGDGIAGVTKIEEFLDPEILPEIDLFVFPDIAFGGAQRYLRSIGKAVWGAMGVNDYEVLRTKFGNLLRELDLPRVESVTIKGLANLSLYLKENPGKWIKINRFRKDMETWHHIDWKHSQQKLDDMAVRFGGLKDEIVFVVQNEIDSNIEIGYDGWSVDGRYPARSFQGYELKNEAYLGSLLDYEDLPQDIRTVNEALAPVLQRAGYRNFLATEIRGGNFIDPTFRMAGLTQEQLMLTCSNLAEVIWSGANGELIEPDFIADYAASATIHYKDHVHDQLFQIAIPEEIADHVIPSHYCRHDGMYHFIPSQNSDRDEIGVVVGVGDSIEDAIQDLKDYFEALQDEPVCINPVGFADLLEQIKAAEDQGMEFTDKQLPDPAVAID